MRIQGDLRQLTEIGAVKRVWQRPTLPPTEIRVGTPNKYTLECHWEQDSVDCDGAATVVRMNMNQTVARREFGNASEFLSRQGAVEFDRHLFDSGKMLGSRRLDP